MKKGKLRILVIGAHPDDADICAGGSAILWAEAGHTVTFLSMTNGATGHYAIGGVELARRRYAEAQASAAVAGIAGYRIVDNHTGELEPTPANRRALIRLIREMDPDLVLTHRTCDYHPDHRATATLVMDAAYLLTVPNVASLTPAPRRPPVICHFWDRFTRPVPFRADVAVAIDRVMERKLDMIHCHTSQVYEWLPYNQGILDQVPAGDAERRLWLAGQYAGRFEEQARTCRDLLHRRYGEAATTMRYAECFELSEYGARPDPEDLLRLFPGDR